MEKLPSTIKECHEIIRLLLDKLEGFSKRIEALELECAQLRTENTQLKERLNNNSSNSSLPPSKSVKKKKNTRQPSGKASGGQKGHKGHYRELLPTAEVDSIKYCELTHCHCGGKVRKTGDFLRHQIHELPEIRLHVTEYQLEKGSCVSCGKKHIARLPAGVTWGITGYRLTSLMSNLVTEYGLSRRELTRFLKEHLQFNLSLGSVFNKQKLVNAALEAPVLALLPVIKESHSIHADETGHNRDGSNQWLWAFISKTAAFFSIQASRGKKVLSAMMGDFKHIVVSDRYAGYNLFDSDNRQLCWAHLKRDFTKLSEKDNEVLAKIGKSLLVCESELFNTWHLFREGQLTRFELQRQAAPIRKRVGELLEQGSYTDPALRVARFCKNILENFNALWTFLEGDGLEPTNNHAERSLRLLVIWRKKYFFTRSDYGSEYVARSASFNTTCKLQGRSIFTTLCILMENTFYGQDSSAILMTT